MLITDVNNVIYARNRWKLSHHTKRSLFIGILIFVVFQIGHFILINHSINKALAGSLSEKGLKSFRERPPNEITPNGSNDKPTLPRKNFLWGNTKRQVWREHIQPPPPLTFDTPSYPTETQPRALYKHPKKKLVDVKSTIKPMYNDRVVNRGVSSLSTEHSSQSAGASPTGLEAEPFLVALEVFYANLLNKTPGGNPEQLPKSFVDIEAGPNIALPHDPSFVEDPALWQACDARNTTFSIERDRLCQKYLRNLDNMRYLQAMSSRLLEARTIKMKIHYAHANLKAIVKISQFNFFYEAASESVAHAYDRVLNFYRIPTTVFMPLPLDFMRAAVSHSPLMSQWFHRHVVLYNSTRNNFVPCQYYTYENTSAHEPQPMCAMVSTQVWMEDVHPLFETFLALPFRYDENFENKYYVPGHPIFQNMKRARLRAIGELQDRFIFDFITGNTDRGMDGHNSFVYGGCSAKTECALEKMEKRNYGLAKYAYLDQGSSLHSYREPQQNPFSGDVSRIKICRFRKSTFENLKRLESRVEDAHPLVRHVDKMLPNEIFKVIREPVLLKTQTRLDKLVLMVENCLTKYSEEDVFSIPDYDKVRIAEEDITLSDE